MLDSIPLGEARLERPAEVVRYTFEHFEDASIGRIHRSQLLNAIPIVPVEAVAAGDVQVIAAREPHKAAEPKIDLNGLADIPSVKSVVASTLVAASRELPGINELLFTFGAPAPDGSTLLRFTGLDSLHARFGDGRFRLDLSSVPAENMRKLAINRWFVASLAPLAKMRGLQRLGLDLFRDPLDAIGEMHELEYLRVRGPAKGWAKLRDCTRLEEAYLIEVQIANLRRWNTWSRLRKLALSGRGLKSLAGLESCQNLRDLTLINLKMHDLSPLRELPLLNSLQLRMADTVDLESVASCIRLRSFIIDSSLRDGDLVQLKSLAALAKAAELEEVVLLQTVVADGDLSPLAELRNLQRVRLGPNIGADVEQLRAARPGLQIEYTPPNKEVDGSAEQIGFVTIQRPRAEISQWSIFQDLASRLGVATNYAAEGRIKREVRKRDLALARRLDWDTEAGAVGCYAETEDDIRTVAEIVIKIGSE